MAKNEHLLERIHSTLSLNKFLFDHFRTPFACYIHGISKKFIAVLQNKIFNISGFLVVSDWFCLSFLLHKNFLHGTLMQVWKSVNIFVFMWKERVEDVINKPTFKNLQTSRGNKSTISRTKNAKFSWYFFYMNKKQ